MRSPFLGASVRPVANWPLRILAALALAAAAASPASADVYSVDFSLADGERVSGLQLEIDSKAIPGGFLGARDAVSCTANPEIDGLFAFNHCDSSAKYGCRSDGQLNAAFVSLKEFEGPLRLFTCEFDAATRRPESDEFVVRVVAANVAAGEGRVVATTARAAASSVRAASRAIRGEVQR